MIEKSINVSDENYFDNFDNPFEPSPLYSTNIPTHDDWNGLPWNNEPISDTASDTDDDDYDWAIFDTYDCPSEALPITKMPDITPEEREICKELRCTSGNNCYAATDSNTSITDTSILMTMMKLFLMAVIFPMITMLLNMINQLIKRPSFPTTLWLKNVKTEARISPLFATSWRIVLLQIII